jgi:hypothetical protein
MKVKALPKAEEISSSHTTTLEDVPSALNYDTRGHPYQNRKKVSDPKCSGNCGNCISHLTTTLVLVSGR